MLAEVGACALPRGRILRQKLPGVGIFGSELGIRFRVYLKYELGVVPKTFLNMEMKALGVL